MNTCSACSRPCSSARTCGDPALDRARGYKVLLGVKCGGGAARKRPGEQAQHTCAELRMQDRVTQLAPCRARVCCAAYAWVRHPGCVHDSDDCCAAVVTHQCRVGRAGASANCCSSKLPARPWRTTLVCCACGQAHRLQKTDARPGFEVFTGAQLNFGPSRGTRQDDTLMVPLELGLQISILRPLQSTPCTSVRELCSCITPARCVA